MRLRIVVIKARALEDDTNRIKELAQRATAVLAYGQRIVRERLPYVKLIAAHCAAVRIRWHVSSFPSTQRFRVPTLRRAFHPKLGPAARITLCAAAGSPAVRQNHERYRSVHGSCGSSISTYSSGYTIAPTRVLELTCLSTRSYQPPP